MADGGIARLKVYGIGKKDWSTVSSRDLVDLVALVNGGVCVGYSDAHYGHPRNMIGEQGFWTDKLDNILERHYGSFLFTWVKRSILNADLFYRRFQSGKS